MPKDGIEHYSVDWLASKSIEGDEDALRKITNNISDEKSKELKKILSTIENGALVTADCKFKWIDEVLSGSVKKEKKQDGVMSKFDKIATNPRWGKVIAVLIIFLGLIASFIPAAPFMVVGMMIPEVFGPPIISALQAIGVNATLIDFFMTAIVNTLSSAISMVGFVFGITLVFGFLEELGYMARISYVFDNAMAKLGLQGKSVMPMLVSTGCTIGGAAATRVIDSWGQRVLTIALAWAVPCGAIWAIIPTLSSMFFGIGGAAAIMVGIIAVMFVHMFITAKIFAPKLSPEEERVGMLMELPPYHKPKWGALFRYVVNRSKDIFFRALRVIFVVSVVFWLLSFSPSGNNENTIMYQIGMVIEPVTSFFGMGWQSFMAFLGSAVSKEAVMGVLSALYAGTGTLGAAMGGGETAENLPEILRAAIPSAQALALIFAVSFNTPCVVAIASTYQETHSLSWTVKIAAYYMGTALIIGFLVYRVGLLIF